MTTENAQVEILSQTNGSFSGGSVAKKLLESGFNVNALRTNDTLRLREWIKFDEKVVEVARKRLVGVADLLNAGLRMPIDNALGVTRVEWEKASTMSDAEVSMSGVTQGTKDRMTFDLEGVPLPIVHKDFTINIRALEAGRKMGQGIDTMQAALSTKIVTEKLETILFKGYAGINAFGSTIYGYTTHPYRNTSTLTANWAVYSTTGANIVEDVIAMINSAYTNNMYGPYMLYIPQSYQNRLQDDYKANSALTIQQRILEIEGIQGVRMSKDLLDGASGEVVLVQMSEEVVDMLDGIQPTLVQWEGEGGFQTNFKVMAIMVPRIRSDDSHQSGIVHYHCP